MGKPGRAEGMGSTSSVYVTDSEEEERDLSMEVCNERVEGRKRAREEGKKETAGSDSEGPSKLQRKESQEGRLSKKIREREINSQKRADESSEQEEREIRAVEDQRKVREERRETARVGGANKADKIEKIQRYTREIMGAIEKESGGRIAFRREDQTTVKRAVYEIQNEVLDMLKIMIRAEERARVAEEELRKNKESMKEMYERAGVHGGSERRSERSRMREISQRKGMVNGNSSSEEWQEIRVRKRKGRTYAEVMKGSENERIEGRIVVPGREGWKTPPPKSATEERPLVVTTREEKDARKLADSLAKNVSVRDMGGAPRAVRKVRVGKLIIVPRDGEQKEKMVGALHKVKGVEVTESKQVEPLLLITGVVRGINNGDLTEQIKRDMHESARKDIKIIDKCAETTGKRM